MLKLKSLLFLITTGLFLVNAQFLLSQPVNMEKTATEFLDYYYSGDLLKAERSLLHVVDSNLKIPDDYVVFVYNSLGIISSQLGKYNDALNYYDIAEKSIKTRKDTLSDLGGLYVNKAIIYGYFKSYSTAIDYFEKGLRIYTGIDNPDNALRQNIATAYLDLGIIYLETGEPQQSLAYFEKSREIKLKYKLPDLAFIDLNLAKAYILLKKEAEAEKLFNEGIKLLNDKFGDSYYRLPEFYFEYSRYLYSAGRNKESLDMLKRALFICKKNYGEKHSLTSFSYKLIGDYFVNRAEYDSAMVYYQESLISVVSNFNNKDILSNPSIDSSLFDIRLLDDLKSKATGLELLASGKTDPSVKTDLLRHSLTTAELSLRLIEQIRNRFLMEESRIYLTENERDTWISAINIADSLYTMTKEDAIKEKMYSMVQRAKASVLRYDISGNRLLYSSDVPKILIDKKNSLSENISVYNYLIREEMKKAKPDSSRIVLWKDTLFEMNRSFEKVSDSIESSFPQYRDLLMKTSPISLSRLRKKLRGNETVVDYLLSDKFENGSRKIYIFLVTRRKLDFIVTDADSSFRDHAGTIREYDTPFSSHDNFYEYTGSLSYMYKTLFKPVEKLLDGQRVIIIPDEEISLLPFDAFIKDYSPPPRNDFENLHFLVYDYNFSTSYSSSLIFGNYQCIRRKIKVAAFSPDYSSGGSGGSAAQELRGAHKEIESIHKWFRGRDYTGPSATETNFRHALQGPVVLHLAMHSVSDTVDSRYSYLIFDSRKDSIEDGRLYNYEIALQRISSPMVVLSACNSGTGTLYHGEGLMSLARGFILSGASSVIKTSWEINDDISNDIISRFYRFLARGYTKDKALSLAKREYIMSSSPRYSAPYYWDAYEILGDNEPLVCNRFTIKILVILVVAAAAWFFLLYRSRRSIFSARS